MDGQTDRLCSGATSKNNCICVYTTTTSDMYTAERSLQVENVRLFALIVTLSVLANASKLWWGI